MPVRVRRALPSRSIPTGRGRRLRPGALSVRVRRSVPAMVHRPLPIWRSSQPGDGARLLTGLGRKSLQGSSPWASATCDTLLGAVRSVKSPPTTPVVGGLFFLQGSGAWRAAR